MRLSCNPILLLYFFLITFLTLFLKPSAKAQSVLASNFSLHNYRHDRSSGGLPAIDSDYPDIDADKPGERMAVTQLSSMSFRRSLMTSYLEPVSHFAIRTSKLNSGRRPLSTRIYSTNIQNNLRITIKLFKVVIVPLWHFK